MSGIKLFCIPYAGGSAASYKMWSKYLCSSIELIPVELAGRGMRFQEHFYDSFTEAVQDIYDVIKNQSGGCKYAIYGHSMGGLLAYEVCRLIRRESMAEPAILFLSGRYPPHMNRQPDMSPDMSNAELKKELRRIGGTPEELFRYRALFGIYADTMRADLKILKQYRYEGEPEPLDMNITVFNGNDDLPAFLAQEWSKYTNNKFDLYCFEGGHFFINDKVQEITNIISRKLIKYIDNRIEESAAGSLQHRLQYGGRCNDLKS